MTADAERERFKGKVEKVPRLAAMRRRARNEPESKIESVEGTAVARDGRRLGPGLPSPGPDPTGAQVK